MLVAGQPSVFFVLQRTCLHPPQTVPFYFVGKTAAAWLALDRALTSATMCAYIASREKERERKKTHVCVYAICMLSLFFLISGLVHDQSHAIKVSMSCVMRWEDWMEIVRVFCVIFGFLR